MRKYNVAIISLLLLAIGVAPAKSQSDAASINGAVFDPSRTSIPGVSVTATNADTQSVVKTLTNEDGKYAFSGLRPGTYNVQASLVGFESAVAQKPVNSGESAQLNFDMKLSKTRVIPQPGDGGPMVIRPRQDRIYR